MRQGHREPGASRTCSSWRAGAADRTARGRSRAQAPGGKGAPSGSTVMPRARRSQRLAQGLVAGHVASPSLKYKTCQAPSNVTTQATSDPSDPVFRPQHGLPAAPGPATAPASNHCAESRPGSQSDGSRAAGGTRVPSREPRGGAEQPQRDSSCRSCFQFHHFRMCRTWNRSCSPLPSRL